MSLMPLSMETFLDSSIIGEGRIVGFSFPFILKYTFYTPVLIFVEPELGPRLDFRDRMCLKVL